MIYCPKAGARHSHRRWEEIRKMLTEQGVDYDFVQSEGRGAEQRLAAMLVKNGYTTIVVVGGDGALNRVINGIAELGIDTLGNIKLGLIPNGHGNDFATFWGLKPAEVERSVMALVKGRTRKIDLGILQSETGVHYFLNCVNIGLASCIFDIKYKSHRFSYFAELSYLYSALVLLFHRLDNHIHLSLNHEHLDRRLMTLCISSCRGYGQTPSAVPYNGMLDVSAVQQPRVTQLFHGLMLLFRGHFMNFKDAIHYRTDGVIDILRTDGAQVSVDGQFLPEEEAPFQVKIMREAVTLIIP